MTKRLYYEDSYLTEFDAVVTSCQEAEGGFKLSLDQSAFYPTSGGQPNDTGRIDKSIVIDVLVDTSGEIWHLVDRLIPADTRVHCKIDWERRFDHMQQHGGEHILAGSLWDLFRGFTHGLHVGSDISTIDITMPDGRTRLEESECLQLENLANSRIQQAAPIKAWFPDTQEMSTLPLRKDPTVHEQVRIVAAGNFEMVACGGTHPKNTGEIGMVKILGTAPVRGKLRLSFLCGARALHYYQALMHSADKISTTLSIPVEDISLGVDRLINQQAALQEELNGMRKESASLKAEALLAGAFLLENGLKLITAQLADASELKNIASLLISGKEVIALLSAPQKDQGLRLLFARSNDLDEDMAALMRHCGAKGGGQPDFAQGSTTDLNILEQAEGFLTSKL